MRLGECLLCKDRFPALEELAIVLIEDGTKLINWEEEEDWVGESDVALGANVILKALNVGDGLMVSISKDNVVIEL